MLGMSTEEIAQLARNSFRYSLAPEVVKQAAFADIDEWALRSTNKAPVSTLQAASPKTKPYPPTTPPPSKGQSEAAKRKLGK
jgi:hypothetical protein